MNKSFECIEKIAIVMADNCFGEFKFPDKVQKFEEEVAELMEQLTINNMAELKRRIDTGQMYPQQTEELLKVKDEMGDVLFVLVHMCNSLGFTASDLLHHAAGKMFNRIKDPNYNKV